jgi:hypothetical protein
MCRGGAADIAHGAGRFAIVIVADVDDQIWLQRGDGLGDAGEWPLLGIVTRLDVAALEPAPGIADDGDVAGGVVGSWSIFASTVTLRAPVGMPIAQAVTGNAADGPARGVIALAVPSIVAAGHCAAAVIARASSPVAEYCSQAEVPAAAAKQRVGLRPRPSRRARRFYLRCAASQRFLTCRKKLFIRRTTDAGMTINLGGGAHFGSGFQKSDGPKATGPAAIANRGPKVQSTFIQR